MLSSAQLKARLGLRLPIIAAPMFLVSGPELVIACSNAGILGTFAAASCRTTEDLRVWMEQIDAGLDSEAAAWAVNIIAHPSNQRLAADLELVCAARVPVVITSIGNPEKIVGAVHAYGGLVLSDISTIRHARKCVAAGVDGLVVLTRGSGGQEGSANPFAFVREIRQFWDGPIALAGGISDGASIRAALALGADLAYMGTPFIASTESMASADYRRMVVEAGLDDIVTTKALSGMNANLLRPSFAAQGIDPETLPPLPRIDMAKHMDPEGLRRKRWKDIWAAGHGVGGVKKVQSVAQFVRWLDEDIRTNVQLCGQAGLADSPSNTNSR
ncbi:NAD(P)H-dependent flavin oxidoreductase [Aliihoeflea sp. PC F10.4]